MLKTQEHADLIAQFEKDCKGVGRMDKEDKSLWSYPLVRVYQDGLVNDLFLAYRKGYAYGKPVGRNEVLLSAPVAVMDSREALGLCAPTEADFPTLYALQGRRVALVDLGP